MRYTLSSNTSSDRRWTINRQNTATFFDEQNPIIPSITYSMDPTTGWPQFEEQLKSALVQMTRSVGHLGAEDLSFHRSGNPDVSESLDEQSNRILSLTSSILKSATSDTDLRGPTLQDEDSIEDNWRGVVDVIDGLLERADACLDEFTGVIKRLSPSQQEQATKPVEKNKASAKFPTIYDYGPSKIPKPQMRFKRPPDNTDMSPFKPLLITKPNATVSLGDSLKPTASGYPHPYATEISASQYPLSVYEVSPPVDYQPFESTTATFVDTWDGVMKMLGELKRAKEIAIDLEHHDVHSYHGIVSLMQISTRDKDWVVDTLQPWREELQVLNDVFTDPAIVKVFHGSSMDIIWLQRDLGLYVVGMFDTYHASCALGYPKRSLKFLLQKFVNFEADKRYQVADWRVRPLPTGMFDYARSDTHYLLYVYDHLRNELVENSTPKNNMVDHVLRRSKEEALQVYERPAYDAPNGQGPGGWYDYLSRGSSVMSKEQFAVFRAVHQWRDQVARAEDEGVQCVFPKHMLFKVAQTMPLDKGTLLRTLSPMTPLTRKRASDLLSVIKEAKIAGATGPEWRDVMKPSNPALVEADQGRGLLTTPVADTDYPTASRCETSQFWGTALDTQQPLTSPEYTAVASAEALRLSLPLPPMPRTVTETREKLGHTPAPPPKPVTPAPAPVQTPEENQSSNIFTVKEKGGPRKRKAESNPPTGLEDPNADTIPLEPEPTEKLTKKQKKKNKKNKAAAQGEQDNTPFNYDAAESVLHAQPAQPSGMPGKKPFNPYAKAMEAPSGVRKGKKEMAGKTFTFR